MKEKIPLKYRHYIGFTAILDTTISTYSMCSIQLKNQANWSGHDSEVEEDYSNKEVVGVTFSRQFDEKYFAKLKDELSSKYNTTLVRRSFMIDNVKTECEIGVYFNCKIVLSKSENILRVSFYEGLTDEELQEYVRYAL